LLEHAHVNLSRSKAIPNYKNLPKLKSENLEIFCMGAIPRKYQYKRSIGNHDGMASLYGKRDGVG
jgi:hypothetical protein